MKDGRQYSMYLADGAAGEIGCDDDEELLVDLCGPTLMTGDSGK